MMHRLIAIILILGCVNPIVTMQSEENEGTIQMLKDKIARNDAVIKSFQDSLKSEAMWPGRKEMLEEGLKKEQQSKDNNIKALVNLYEKQKEQLKNTGAQAADYQKIDKEIKNYKSQLSSSAAIAIAATIAAAATAIAAATLYYYKKAIGQKKQPQVNPTQPTIEGLKQPTNKKEFIKAITSK